METFFCENTGLTYSITGRKSVVGQSLISTALNRINQHVVIFTNDNNGFRAMKRIKFFQKTARLLMLLFAGFISIFALDVFENPDGIIHTVAALGIHLLPTFLIIGLILLSRKSDLLPAIAYIALGFLYIWWAWDRFPFTTYIIIAGPLFLAGVLHGICWSNRKSVVA
ncbi:MAG: hypothetical protein RL213_2121 [Bacteroidota bacterium]|jgi:hypothetical protein